MNPVITPAVLAVQKVPGSLSNSIFFISCPSVPATMTILLRIYGLPSGFFISRPQELRTVITLSSQFHIGPRIYGTFENGRVEEYFESVTLTASDLRNPEISNWIAFRMAELHSVDIGTVDEAWSLSEADGFESGLGLNDTIKSWLHIAWELLDPPIVDRRCEGYLGLDAFENQWQRYLEWLSDFEGREGRSRRVLSHNDVRRRNILRLTEPDAKTLDYRQVSMPHIVFFNPQLFNADSVGAT
jgi:choline kinase